MKTDNELIAEFMEIPMTHDSKGTLWDNQRTGKSIYFIRSTELGYHRSWDWLMPVVEKIKILQDKIHFDKRGEELISTIERYLCLVQIEDAHMYVVEFIKWHNELSKPKDVFDTGARLPEQKEIHPSFVHTQSTEVKIKEQEKEEDQDIKQIELLIWHGKRALCEEKCQCHSECNKADEFVEEFKSKFRLIRNK